MIVYGLTMQHKPQEVPTEVAAWVTERNSRYPAIDFQIEWQKAFPEDADLVRKYSRTFGFQGKDLMSVNFLYPTEYWCVRIIGGINAEGHMVNPSYRGEIKPLGDLRNEIAGYVAGTGEKLSEKGVGILRTEKEPYEKPVMVPFPSDYRYTSELSLSGKELQELQEAGGLLADPKTRDEAVRAIRAKDWQTLKRLKEER